MFNFLILSLFSGVIELGAVYIGIVHKLPMHLIIILPLFYQTGNLMMSLIPPKPSLNIILAGIVCFLSLAYCRYPTLWILAIQLAFSSYCIQLTRAQHKSICPTWLKRSFRIAGFALSPIMLLGDGQLILPLSMLLCVFLVYKDIIAQSKDKKIIRGKETKVIGISMVMIFHQMHYFVYTYIMPIYIYQMTGNIIISGLIFSATWVVYLLPQTFAEKFNIINYKKIFFICHIFLGLCMACIAISAYFNKIMYVLFFWLLTGFGGGSVFCIRYLSKKYEFTDMDFSENIGHFFGPLVAVVLCFLFTEHIFAILPFISCIFVIVALIFSLYIVKEAHYE